MPHDKEILQAEIEQSELILDFLHNSLIEVKQKADELDRNYWNEKSRYERLCNLLKASEEGNDE